MKEFHIQYLKYAGAKVMYTVSVRTIRLRHRDITGLSWLGRAFRITEPLTSDPGVGQINRRPVMRVRVK